MYFMQDHVEIVTKDDVLKHIKKGDAVIVNVLAKSAYDDVHIRGSISIPFDQIEGDGWKQLDRRKKVITYCASSTCNASKKAAAILMGRGLNAAAYEGGIKEWVESRLPTDGIKR